jgi:hypothetical protein
MSAIRLLIAMCVLSAVARAEDILGVKIYYSKSVVRISWADFQKQWAKAPADDVQVIRVYYARTYDANGQNRHFVDSYEGTDYYYWSPSKGFGKTNLVTDIPEDVPTVKLGRWMSDDGFLSVYNRSHNDFDF